MRVKWKKIYFLAVLSVENWEIFEQVMDYSYKKHIKSESHLHPVLLSEASVSICLYMFG